MNKNFYLKKYYCEAFNRVCILLLSITPFAVIWIEGASWVRGIALMIAAATGLIVSIYMLAKLDAKEAKEKEKLGRREDNPL